MRKLKLQVQMTLDGFIGGVNGEMDWMTFPWTADINAYVSTITDSFDTIVLGRKLAEGFIPHWASVAADPENPEFNAGKKFSETPTVVFTKTLSASLWSNATLATGELVEEIIQLKKQEGKDMMAYGGASFVSALIQHELIDEFYLFINPVAIGKGLSIFKKLEVYQKLHLINATSFDCGIVVLHYESKQDKN